MNSESRHSLDIQKMAAARLWAANKFPYLASALFACRVLSAPGIGAIVVDDRWRIYADPSMVNDLSTEQLGGLLVHHTGHLLRDHSGRAEALGITKQTSKDWLMAADAEINDDLVDVEGLEFPSELITPASIGCEDGHFAEEYYAHLGEAEHQHEGECGSGVDGVAREWDSPDGGIEQSSAHLLRCHTAAEVLRFGEGKEPGAVPEGLQRWAFEILQTKIDWRRILAAEIRSGVAVVSGRVDYSYQWPSRRASVSKNVILPALRRPVPEVAVICDTSGSMDEVLLGQALGQVEGLIRSLGVRKNSMRVLSCDAAVHMVQRISRASDITLYGGGGTNMGEGLAAAANLKPRPQVVVVLTDGYTPWPSEPPPRMRVVVGLMGTPPNRPPSWAKVVEIEDAA
ncbi:MAG: VWA-like domain-containing protein [Actinomycetota bacterium]